MKHFTTRQTTAIVIIALIVLGFGFYWYQIRPVRISRACSEQASLDAHKLLLSKAELTTDTQTKTSYSALAEKGMYLRTDYNSFLLKCMLHYGFQIVPISNNTPAPLESVPDPQLTSSAPAKTGMK